MRIDWTQTLMGSADGGAGREGASPAPAGEGARGLLLQRHGVARLAGVLSVSVCLGLVILAWPVRGPAATIIDSLGLCGILIAQVFGFLAQMLGFPARRAPLAWLCTLSGCLGVPFAIAAGMPAGVVAALAALAALEAVLVPLALRMPALTPLAPSLCAALIAAAGAGFAEGPGMLAALVCASAPTLAFCALRLDARARFGAAVPMPGSHLPALLSAALDSTMSQAGVRQTLVTDQVGVIDQGIGAALGERAAGLSFPEGSIVSATLIADRVALLDALSRAIHRAERSEGLVIRLRTGPQGAGYPAPPRYEPFVCTILPIAAISGRALIILAARNAPDGTSAAEADAANAGIKRAPGDIAALTRALHDCNGAFNAGLGFVEMIADPRLAPRDLATYRDFAAEAHKALSEAHRNTVMLGQWLRLALDPEHPESDRAVPVSRLVGDSVRMLNLGEAVRRGEITIELATMPASPLRVPLVAARFAVAALLRFASSSPASSVTAFEEGDDVVISARLHGGAGEPIHDPLQFAFHSALAGQERIRFGTLEPGEHHVRLVRALAEGSGAAARGEPAGPQARSEPARLAS